ncbi:AAA family ATPase [Brevundimonas sp.]|uniref:AAA family ATPase n=1 Tax=Brevundimonas sp. TaxID=1871086 RepID=UPI001A2A991F|nr:AAA family ATPase [Brevundimonas sp.]MBJ7484346.1 AAA family ATPase [Brevundimonas sp.]
MTAAASPFAQAAPTLIDLGFSPVGILPVSANHAGRGLAPGVYRGAWSGRPDWQKLRDESLNSFEFGLAMKAPDSGVGIVLGSRAGSAPDGTPLYAIAVDLDATDIDALDTLMRATPASPMIKRGSKGETRILRAPKSIVSKSYDGPDGRLLDLLTGFSARQTVCPPSISPRTGHPYVWLKGPVRADELPVFDEDDLQALEEALETCGWVRGGRAASGRDGERKPYVPAEHGSDDVFDRVKAAALANLPAWVPDLPGLYGLRPARGGYEAVNTLRDSSSGQPLERRKRNLSIQASGVKDFGTGETWSAIDLVSDFADLSISESVSWLEQRLGLADDGSVTIDLVPGRDDESDLPAPLRNLGPPLETRTPPLLGRNDGAGERLGGNTEDAAFVVEAPTHGPARSAGRVIDFAEWRSSRFVGDPPEIDWLIRDVVPMAIPLMVAAPGDCGKSMSILDAARRIAFGASPLEGPCFGGMIAREGTCVIITAEDDAGSIHRRLANLDPANARFTAKGERLIVVPLPDAGGPLPIVREGRKGLEVTDAYKRLADDLAAIDDLAMVVLDPLQAFVHAPINEDPAAGQFVCSTLAVLAARTQAAVMVSHHTRKNAGDRGKGITTLQEAREAVRGTTALVDGLRLVYSLWPETDSEGRKICDRLGVPYQANKVVRGGIVKANGPGIRRISTYVRNETGLLVDQTMLLSEAPGERREQMDALASAVAAAAISGQPFTRTGLSGLKEQSYRLPPILRDLGRPRLLRICEDALERGIIIGALAKGSTTTKWLDVPGGPFATGTGEFMVGQPTDGRIAA